MRCKYNCQSKRYHVKEQPKERTRRSYLRAADMVGTLLVEGFELVDGALLVDGADETLGLLLLLGCVVMEGALEIDGADDVLGPCEGT